MTTPAQDLGCDPQAIASARGLARAGIPVFVAPPNPNYGAQDRREYQLPPGWQHTKPDPAALDLWQHGWAVCIVTGHGVDGVDVDPKNGADLRAQRERLDALGVVVLAVVLTPSGGAHFYVRSTGICSAASSSTGVDYRGRGIDGTGAGFLYAPGTARPKYDGGGYLWAQPFTEDDLADLTRNDDDAGAVEAYLTGLGVDVRTGAEGPAAEVVEAGPLPMLPGWLADELADLGTATTDDRGTRVLRWADKDGNLSHTRSERFYRLVAMCRRARLSQASTVAAVTPWCRAVGKYANREAAEVARIWHDVAPPAEGPPTGQVASGTALAVVNGDGAGLAVDDEPWPDIVPLDVHRPAPVPLDSLPGFLRRMVEAVEEQSQAPREVILAAALGTLAAATRGAWDVHVDPGWPAATTVLWLAALASSGERKGAGTNPIVAPLHDAEHKIAAEVRRANRNRDAERKRISAALKKAETDGDPALCTRLSEALHEARARTVPGMIISEATTEALGAFMTEQGGAAAIMGTEAASFQTVAGRYDKNRQGNYSLPNHAYDAEVFNDKRINRNGIDVRRPALTWSVSVQPEVMAGYANGDSEGSGFLLRFIIFAPEPRQGHIRYRTQPVPLEVAEEWRMVVERLHAEAWRRYAAMVDKLPDELGKPARITFAEDAAELLIAYAERVQAEIREGQPIATLKGWASKAPTRIARIAAILALAEDPGRHTVELRHAEAAMSLADPITAHALAGFAILRQVARRGHLGGLVSVLQRIGTPTFSTREVHRAVNGQAWVGGVEDVRRALADLEAHGYVRLQEQPPGQRGRPSETWALHPRLLA